MRLLCFDLCSIVCCSDKVKGSETSARSPDVKRRKQEGEMEDFSHEKVVEIIASISDNQPSITTTVSCLHYVPPSISSHPLCLLPLRYV